MLNNNLYYKMGPGGLKVQDIPVGHFSRNAWLTLHMTAGNVR